MAVAGLFMAVDRASAGAFAPLAADATALGFEVEWDRAVPGGDAWWAATLAKVERADAFVYVVTATSIAAKSCQAQLRYAIALGTPVLPVLVADDISDVDLPRSLGQLQRIDYRDPSSSAMARLFAALRGLPPRARGPELVPTPPCPRELSLDIAARLALPEPLSRPEQDAILDQLGYYVSCGYSAAEVRDVLHRLRRRRSDMLPSNRQQLEELDTALGARRRPPADTSPDGTRSGRGRAATGRQRLRELQPGRAPGRRSIGRRHRAPWAHGVDRPEPAGRQAVVGRALEQHSRCRRVRARRRSGLGRLESVQGRAELRE